MIKLNNKNITYVALADSNNSVKGVKEVWYADSANSVKLVYRRKDALIEGEDYEKYHWIVATIPVGVLMMSLPLDTNNFYYKRKWHIFGNVSYFLTDSHVYFTYYSNRKVAVYDKSTGDLIVYGNSIDADTEIVIDSNSSHTLINNIDVPMYGNTATSMLFQNMVNGQNTSELSTSAITVDGSVRYIPVKLLKPVPKWLDANGIRRQVGECGMIDLVSGKFYGNVNSVGTFTVENYYERKEWLQGRNGAYIDTNYYPIVGTDIFSVHFHYDGTTRNPDGVEQCIFGCTNMPYGRTVIRAYINGGNCLSVNYNNISGNYFPSTNVNANNWEIADLKLAESNFSFIANGVTYTFSNNDVQIETIPNSIYVFKILQQTYNYNCYFHGDIAYFKITDNSSNTKMNLIPCTLTMDLPASMDANNIARTKGTSGMWDLVSDRFYGNVANSGTFKAVNLAEGVDYEVHDKLIMHGTSGGYGANMKFAESPISLSEKIMRVNIGLNRIFIICTSPHYYLAIYSYGSSGLFIVRQWAASDPNNVIFFQQTHIDGQELVVNFSTRKMQYGEYEGNIISNETYTVQASQNYYESPHNSKTVRNFKIDGVIDLIPVKLLRSIPSKYDANGIARQAGECGMYDTVNDVFYGNVASSGSFTVEDDN